MTTKSKNQIKEAIDYFVSNRDNLNVIPETDNPYILKFFSDVENEYVTDSLFNEYLDWYITNLHDTLAVDRIKSNISKGMEYAEY